VLANNRISVASLLVIISLLAGCANTPEGESARRGAGYGAAGGAVMGLALGAMTGDASLAVAGAATGAVAGGAAGAMYEYDQHREDNRTRMMADAIGGAQKGETVDDAGKRHLDDFIGEWNINAWGMVTDGKKITATGKAKGVLESKTKASIKYSDLKSPDYESVLSGELIMRYDEKNGFSLENRFSSQQQSLTFVGEYIPDGNKYNYYPTSGEGEESISGVIRSNLRVEIRVSGNNMWVAETFTFIDGKEVMIQSYRFTRS
jgi:uncharacterized protein YjbJ (UPF0337 family)